MLVFMEFRGVLILRDLYSFYYLDDVFKENVHINTKNFI